MDKAIHTDKHGTETTKAKVDQLLLREKIKQLREKGYEQEVRAFVLDAKEKQLEYEYRYNHYHDPHNGRFASGAGGGVGLYYSMGKGKGEIIGASSAYNSSIANNLVNRYNDKMHWISSDDAVKKIIKGGSSYGVEDAKEFLEKTQKSFEKYKKDIEQSGENSKYYRERMAAVNSALNRISSVKNSLKNYGQQSFF